MLDAKPSQNQHHQTYELSRVLQEHLCRESRWTVIVEVVLQVCGHVPAASSQPLCVCFHDMYSQLHALEDDPEALAPRL